MKVCPKLIFLLRILTRPSDRRRHFSSFLLTIERKQNLNSPRVHALAMSPRNWANFGPMLTPIRRKNIRPKQRSTKPSMKKTWTSTERNKLMAMKTTEWYFITKIGTLAPMLVLAWVLFHTVKTLKILKY